MSTGASRLPSSFVSLAPTPSFAGGDGTSPSSLAFVDEREDELDAEDADGDDELATEEDVVELLLLDEDEVEVGGEWLTPLPLSAEAAAVAGLAPLPTATGESRVSLLLLSAVVGEDDKSRGADFVPLLPLPAAASSAEAAACSLGTLTCGASKS